MARKPHPADLRDARLIAGAVAFCACLRVSPTETHRAEAATAEAALEAAERLSREYRRYGRRACAYAISPTGGAVLLTPTLLALAREAA